ncbi:Aste57867_17496 [Aphanomyces stellatus]|uniref:Aste57867_17496 protein n=1 Tax=Aphanomyces stellatus TaxID=120398 RepID=A0A485L965_9STRA|nr:hypothetical protein As57867_017436 [Aphanomyces stellatus]VFT94249.1 Aste57867_17496 [Aphanomyces stellatus]
MNILALIAFFAAAVAAAPCTNTDFVALAPQALGCALASGLTAPPASVADFVTKEVAALCAKDACKGLVSAVSALSCSVDPQGVLPNSAITCANDKAQGAANATQGKPMDLPGFVMNSNSLSGVKIISNGTSSTVTYSNGTTVTLANGTTVTTSNSTKASATSDSRIADNNTTRNPITFNSSTTPGTTATSTASVAAWTSLASVFVVAVVALFEC